MWHGPFLPSLGVLVTVVALAALLRVPGHGAEGAGQKDPSSAKDASAPAAKAGGPEAKGGAMPLPADVLGGSKKGEGAGGGSGRAPGEGWEAFTDKAFLLEVIIALVMAAALGTSIAYHPRTYRKAATLEEVDQPKILIMYSVVGCIVAEIVKAYPEMSLVIFAVGGLMRFRTDVGPARDTGRVILVTLIGLACGLKIYVVAILATCFGWALIHVLESSVTHRVLVKGLEAPLLAKSAEAYLEVLRENGFTVMSQKKNFLKGQVAFVFRAPGGLDREVLESLFKDIPPKLQGAVDWESN